MPFVVFIVEFVIFRPVFRGCSPRKRANWRKDNGKKFMTLRNRENEHRLKFTLFFKSTLLFIYVLFSISKWCYSSAWLVECKSSPKSQMGIFPRKWKCQGESFDGTDQCVEWIYGGKTKGNEAKGNARQINQHIRIRCSNQSIIHNAFIFISMFGEIFCQKSHYSFPRISISAPAKRRWCNGILNE